MQDEIQNIIDKGDYLGALKIINNKGLLPHTKLTAYFGWKKDYYINYVLELLNSGDEEGNKLKEIFKKHIIID
ncbi:MAG TPA: hypothetical protein VFD03_10635 [Clostridia bacterium]|nr:hypothetical protein [Clostridia bacterium]